MARATRTAPSQHLSAAASSEIIRALGAWRDAHSLTDYDLAAIAGVSRDTIGRWRRRPVALPAETVETLIESIREYAEMSTVTRLELERLLTAAQDAFVAAENDPIEQVRRRLNARRLRAARVLAEIEAAGFHIVAKDE